MFKLRKEVPRKKPFSMTLTTDVAGGIRKNHRVPWVNNNHFMYISALCSNKSCILSLPRFVTMVERFGADITQNLTNGREVFVLSDNSIHLPVGDAITVSTVDEAIELSTRDKIVCIGSVDIYKTLFDKLDYIYYSMFNQDYGCDEHASELLDDMNRCFEQIESVSFDDDVTHFVYKRVRR